MGCGCGGQRKTEDVVTSAQLQEAERLRREVADMEGGKTALASASAAVANSRS